MIGKEFLFEVALALNDGYSIEIGTEKMIGGAVDIVLKLSDQPPKFPFRHSVAHITASDINKYGVESIYTDSLRRARATMNRNRL